MPKKAKVKLPKIIKRPDVLTSQKDVKDYRGVLLSEQNGLDAILGELIREGKSCLDHDHSSQRCRGILDRNVNAWLGRLENSFVREMKWLTDKDLPTCLELAAAYLRKDSTNNPFHPGFIKKATIEFSKLTAKQKKSVLEVLGLEDASNDKLRKATFKKKIQKGEYSFTQLKEIIEKSK